MKNNYYENEVRKLHGGQSIVVKDTNNPVLVIGTEYDVRYNEDDNTINLYSSKYHQEYENVDLSSTKYTLIDCYEEDYCDREDLPYNIYLVDDFVSINGECVPVKQWEAKFENGAILEFDWLNEINEKIVEETIHETKVFAIFAKIYEDIDYGIDATMKFIGVFDKETADKIMKENPNTRNLSYSMVEVSFGRDYRTAGGGMPKLGYWGYCE